MATPGLLFAFSKPKAGLSEKDYNEWYSNHHIQDVVKCGLADLAIRYKNINPEAKWPYLAIYRLPDLAKLQDQSVMGAIPSKHDLLGEKAWTDVMDADIRPFIRTQTFEGQIPKDGEWLQYHRLARLTVWTAATTLAGQFLVRGNSIIKIAGN